MQSILLTLCITALVAVALAEPPPEAGYGGKTSVTIATAAGKGVRYAGPIVYGEKPPVIHFPPPPDPNKGGGSSFGGGWKSKGRTQSIKYVPLPHHDLPVLIYQSDINPPIHVVHPPKGSALPPPPPPPPPSPQLSYGSPQGEPLDSYGPVTETKTTVSVSSAYGPPSQDSYGTVDSSPLQDSYGPPPKGDYGAGSSAPESYDAQSYSGGASSYSVSHNPPASSSSSYEIPAVSNSYSSSSYGQPQNSIVAHSYGSKPAASYGEPIKTSITYGPPLPPSKPLYSPAKKAAPLPHIIYAGHPPIHIFTTPIHMEAPKAAIQKAVSFTYGLPQSSYGPPKIESQPAALSYGTPLGEPLHSYGNESPAPLDSYGPPSSSVSLSHPPPPQENFGHLSTPVDTYSPAPLESYGPPPAAPPVLSYGQPQAPVLESYSAPQKEPLSSYGSPSGSPLDSYSHSSSSHGQVSLGQPQTSHVTTYTVSHSSPQENHRPLKTFHGRPKPSIFSFGKHLHGASKGFSFGQGPPKSGPPKLVSVTTSYGPPPKGFGRPPPNSHSHAPIVQKARPKYAIAPKAWHKPPIIIYQGVKPPVHVFQKPSGGYAPSHGPSTDVADLTYASRSSNIPGQFIDFKPAKPVKKLQPALWLRTFGVPESNGGLKTMYVSDLTSAGTQYQTYFLSNPMSIQQMAKAAVSPTPLLEAEQVANLSAVQVEVPSPSPSSQPLISISPAEILSTASTVTEPRLDVLPAFISNSDSQTLKDVPMSYQSIVVQSSGSSGEVTASK